MLFAPGKVLKSSLRMMPCFIIFIVTGGSQRDPTKSSKQSTSDSPVYFPSEQNRTPILYVALASLSEPSLYESAKDKNVFSFRASYFSPVPERAIAVRLVLHSDGTGQITSAFSSGEPSGVKRTQNNVSAVDANKLLQLVAKVEFWSMASVEDDDKTTNTAGRRAFVMDGSHWMVEGVHDGSFHYVYRQNPKSSPVTEIACTLAKELTKPADAEILITLCPSRLHYFPNRD
jgi:hypothetical protein